MKTEIATDYRQCADCHAATVEWYLGGGDPFYCENYARDLHAKHAN